MADDTKQPHIGGPNFIWILVAAAATYFVTQPGPLTGSRPATTDRSLPERVGEQHVDARLWQDPFAAVADALTKSPELKPENCHRPGKGNKDIETYCRAPWKTQDVTPDLVLMVSVSGAPYADDQEERRRRRYAVLAGLDAEGFVPEDPQHIGFYWPDPPLPQQDTMTVHMAATPADPLLVDLPALQTVTGEAMPKVVPYEWFKPRPERPYVKASYQRILLLWFNEDVLAGRAKPAQPRPPSVALLQGGATSTSSAHPGPLQQYAKLLCDYLREPSAGPVKVLGPQLSTTLKAMVDETDRPGSSKEDWSGGACPKSVAPKFYVSQATVGDATLLPERAVSLSCLASHTCLSKFFEDKKSVKLYRLTATDDALARTIGDELARRGVALHHEGDRRSHIALISEWDTLYGRSLPDTMARCLGRSPCEPAGNDPFQGKTWLHPFAYVRGLDGQMPNVGGLNDGPRGKDAGSKPEKDSKDNVRIKPDPNVKARAEGQSQFDYLQRLGDRIQHLDAELRSEGRRGIEAVGVLGSDLYDKLLVLQALRPLLPNAWFFTTDLDALLLHPTAQSVSRNLLVASGFGLQLRPDVQGAVPPFRGNYQTAEFLTARVAIHSDSAPNPCWTGSPLLFEIGSAREFQFAETASPETQACKAALLDCEESPPGGRPPGACTAAHSEGLRPDHTLCKDELTSCRLIQPVATPMWPRFSSHASLGLAGIGLCVGLGLVGIPLAIRRLRKETPDVGAPATSKTPAPFSLSTWALVALGLVIIVGVVLIVATPVEDWLTQGGQPMLLLEGISLWPAILLRLATLLLCIWLLLYSLDKLNANMAQIERELHLEQKRDEAKDGWAGLPKEWSFWTKLAYSFGYDPPNAAGDDMSCFWRKYFYRGRLGPRLGRVLIGVVAVLGFWGVLVLIFGNAHAPTRDYVSVLLYHGVTIVLFIFTLTLIFFVGDATWLCWRLARDIRPETVFWPPRTLEEFSQRYGLLQEALADCLDLLFLARRSKCITTLLYGPFLIIALIVVSHSPLLAHYGRSIPALVTMGLAVLIVIGCVVALRISAEATRIEARRRLTERLIRAKGVSNDAPFAGQLELVLRRIEELRDGAFSPFTQQPVVRAMLLPLGGLGGTALLNYLLLPGLG
jgi:hypothetical protein